jgi:hypothetical protein
MIYNLLSPEKVYFSDTLEPISLWLTLGFALCIVLSLAVCFFIAKDKLGTTLKSSIIAFVFYALILGIILLVAEIAKKFDLAYLEDNWVSKDVITHILLPLLISLVVALIGGIILFVLSKRNSTFKKTFTIIYSVLLAVSLIVTLVLTYFHYANNINGDGYYTSPDAGFNSTLLYVLSGVLVALTVILSLFLGRKDKTPFTSKTGIISSYCGR